MSRLGDCDHPTAVRGYDTAAGNLEPDPQLGGSDICILCQKTTPARLLDNSTSKGLSMQYLATAWFKGGSWSIKVAPQSISSGSHFSQDKVYTGKTTRAFLTCGRFPATGLLSLLDHAHTVPGAAAQEGTGVGFLRRREVKGKPSLVYKKKKKKQLMNKKL